MGISDWLKSKKEKAQDAERARIRKEMQDELIERRKADIDASIAAARKADAKAKREAELTPEQLEHERFNALPLAEQKDIVKARQRLAELERVSRPLAAKVIKVSGKDATVLFPVGSPTVPNDTGTIVKRNAYILVDGKAIPFRGELAVGMEGILVTDSSQPQFTTKSTYENSIVIAPESAWLLVVNEEDTDK